MTASYCMILGGHRIYVYSNGDVQIEQFQTNGHIETMGLWQFEQFLEIRKRFIEFQTTINKEIFHAYVD